MKRIPISRIFQTVSDRLTSTQAQLMLGSDQTSRANAETQSYLYHKYEDTKRKAEFELREGVS